MKWRLYFPTCDKTQNSILFAVKDVVELILSMGQVSPKASKELHRSLLLKNVTMDSDMKKKVKDDDKTLPILLSPEKARDTATWIMTTW